MRRTGGIGGRFRRRTTAVGLGALALVVVVAAPLVGRPADGPPPAPHDPAPSASPVADVECPPPPPPDSPATPVGGSATLPDDPVAVRMCDPGGLLGRAPLDALTAGAPEVATAVNALPVAAQCSARPADLGPTWDLVFRYADGSHRTVRGSAHGCGGVEVGPVTRGDRSNARRPLRAFQRLLWQQRVSGPSLLVEVAQPRCPARIDGDDPGPTMMPLEQPLTAELASLCWTFDTQAKREPQSAAIPREDLAILLEDLNTHSTRDAGTSDEECHDPAQARWRIQGVNAWGDHFELDGWCGVFGVSIHGATTHWRPSAASRRILDSLTETQPVIIETPDASTRPSRIVELWADLHNAGRAKRAAALWHIDPPSPEGRVEVSVESIERVEPPPRISAPTVIRVVTALYWVVAPDGSWDEVHEMEFVVTRFDPGQIWRIASATDHGVVPVGR